jgi:putative glutamine amidotransferase
MEANKIRPIIGLTADFATLQGSPFHRLREAYVAAIVNAGGAPMIIPSTADDASLRALYEHLDGLLLTGGADIDPQIYGALPDGADMDDLAPTRDHAELTLARWALAENLPVLGICRGHQVLNVAAGGTLFQDIPQDFSETEYDHRGSFHAGIRGLPVHGVSLAPDCRLATVFGSTDFEVNSLHHQSIRTPGKGLRVVGWSPDGVAEALESVHHRWVLSVQWHPEEMFRDQTEANRLFRFFVEAATENAVRDALLVA